MIEQKSFNILSIDGGGIRGLIPAKVLSKLEDELRTISPDKKLYEHFDLICGTSTGAILAIGIALGIPASEMVKFYKQNARDIFPGRTLGFLPRKFRALVSPIYDSKRLRCLLKDIYSKANGGKAPLLGELKTKVCIPAFRGSEGTIRVFKTKHHVSYDTDHKCEAHEVALSSSSAPIYFSPHSFRTFGKEAGRLSLYMVDGGVYANNPSLIGILEAADRLGQEFSNIRLLSLGTGMEQHIIKKGWNIKNLFYWVNPTRSIVHFMLDCQEQITEQYIQFLKRATQQYGSGFEYKRVQCDLTGNPIDMDDSRDETLQRLEAKGDFLAQNEVFSIINFLKPN